MRYFFGLILSFFLVQNSTVFAQDIGSNLSWEEAQEMLKLHNKIRKNQGKQAVKWSNSLAESAQQWATQLANQSCAFKHSKSKYGENIYWISTTGNVKNAFNSWITEKKYYKGQKINSKNYHRFGHYTQIIWGNTTEIGCGKATCANGSEIWVCQYNPPGNFIGQRP